MLHLVSGIKSLYLFVNLILVPVPPFPTQLCLHPSLLPLLIHHSAHPLLHLALFHSLLKTYLFHKSCPRISLLPPGLPSRTTARTVSSELLDFVFSFSLFFFVSVQCTRLSWPYHQLLSARRPKFTVSYRIVSYILI